MSIKRIIYYWDINNNNNNILDIIKKPIYVTHIHISSLYFKLNEFNQPSIYLNDIIYNDIYDNFWYQLKLIVTNNIKVIFVIGKNKETFNNYDVYYSLLYKLIFDKIDIIDGIDINIKDDYTNFDNIQKIINSLSKIKLYKNDFIISLSLFGRNLYNQECIKFNDFYKTTEGLSIDYFNCQFDSYDYSFEKFKMIIDNGYSPNKIVIGCSDNYYNKLGYKYYFILNCIKKEWKNMGGIYLNNALSVPSFWPVSVWLAMNSN